MSRMLVYLLRFAVMILGYAAAAVAASAFMHLITLGAAGFTGQGEHLVVTNTVVVSVLVGALFVAYFAFIPTLPLVLVAEMLGRRDWLFYALGGGVVAAAALGILWLGAEPMARGFGIRQEEAALDGAFGDPSLLMFAIAGGIVGGIAYWLVAGRFAGNWFARARPAARAADNRPADGSLE